MKDISDKLIKDIFDSIESKSGLKLINRIHSDSYFIFQFAKNTINSFKIKGLNWSFGLWIRENEEGKINLVFFYIHNWYIDKFKPSYADNEIEEMFDDVSDITLSNKKVINFIDNVAKELKRIKNNKITVFSETYCPLGVNKYINYLKRLYYHNIVEKYIELKDNQFKYIQMYWIIFIAYLKHFRHIFNIRFKIIDRKDIYPRYELHAIIDKKVTDESLYESLYYYFDNKIIYNVRLENYCYYENENRYKPYHYYYD